MNPLLRTEEGLFKMAVQQGRKPRGGRAIHGGTLSPPSKENAAGGHFQQSHKI